MSNMEEKDLYQPIKALFTGLGFDVYGEVKSVDVIAKRDQDLIAIELKKELSLHLISQGAQRQRLTDHVYVAIPTPTVKVQRGMAFRDKLYLMRRLGIGLIFVNIKRKPHGARIILDPHILDIVASQRRNKKRRLALLQEISKRHRDYNTGGTRGKIMTAYREESIRVLHHIRDGKIYKGVEVRKAIGIEKATTILNKNYYGWFTKVDRGLYRVSPGGLKALEEYDPFIQSIL